MLEKFASAVWFIHLQGELTSSPKPDDFGVWSADLGAQNQGFLRSGELTAGKFLLLSGSDFETCHVLTRLMSFAS